MKSDEEHISLGTENGADLDGGATETSSLVGTPEKATRGRKPERKKREEKSYRDVTAGLQQTIPDMMETRSTKKGKASKGATPPPSVPKCNTSPGITEGWEVSSKKKQSNI